MIFQRLCKADNIYTVPKRFFHALKHILVLLVFFLKLLFLFIGQNIKPAVTDICELLIIVFTEHFKCKFIHIIRKIQNFKAFIFNGLYLRQHINFIHCLAGSIIYCFLIFFHA